MGRRTRMRTSHAWRTVVPALALALVVSALLAGLSAAPPGNGTPATAEKKTAEPAAKPEPADNSYCYVCHANYEEEKLTHVHQPQGVGCERCHGPSVKHSGDEDGLSPPDRMFAKEDIDAFCITCHPEDRLRKEEIHREWMADSPRDGTCNECHAKEHRMKVRTRHWDKKTRKLIQDDGVRMMQKDSPASGDPTKPSK